MSIGLARLREEPDRIRQGAIDKGEDPTIVDQALALEAVVHQEIWLQDLVVAEVAEAPVSQAMVEVHLLLAKDLDQVQALEGLVSV